MTKIKKETRITNPKREELKKISAPLKALLKDGAITTINEGLKEIYKAGGHNELKTLRQWNRDGKRIIKGEKALLLWGSPRKIDLKKAQEADEADKLDFFPICYVFSNKQVEERKEAVK